MLAMQLTASYRRKGIEKPWFENELDDAMHTMEGGGGAFYRWLKKDGEHSVGLINVGTRFCLCLCQ